MKKQTKYLISGGVFAFVFALTLFLSNNLIGDTYAISVNDYTCSDSGYNPVSTGSTNVTVMCCPGDEYLVLWNGVYRCAFKASYYICGAGQVGNRRSDGYYDCLSLPAKSATLKSSGGGSSSSGGSSSGGSSSGSSGSSCTSTKKMYVTPVEGLNVRSGPSTSYSIVGGYGYGAAVNVCSDYYKNGWYKLSSGNYIYGGDGYLKSTAPTTTVTKNTYNIYYNANGGSGQPSSQVKTEGKTLTLSSTKPTRKGYTFLGWSTSKTATSAAYSAGGSYTSNKSTTLYAVWKANTIKVVYKANGGTGTMSDSSFTYGIGMNLAENKFTRTGYTFDKWQVYRDFDSKWRGYNSENVKGWYSKSDIVKYVLYEDKTKISLSSPSGTIYLYAKWNANKYTIEYKPGDGGTGTAMANTTVTYGKDTILRENTYTKEGYKFGGWQVCRNSDNKCRGYNSENVKGWYSSSDLVKYYLYSDKTTVNTTTSVNNAIVTMTATWIEVETEDTNEKVNSEDKDTSVSEVDGTDDDVIGEEEEEDEEYLDADDPAIGSNYGKSDIKDKTDDELTSNSSTGSAFIIVTIVLAIISLGLCGYYFYKQRKNNSN